jgi:hypothetical protein
MEYKGFEIVVRPDYVVLGEDPMGAVVPGFVAEVCKRDVLQDDPDGRVMWDYPFGAAESRMQGATEDDVVEAAKAFIDAGGRRGGDAFAPRRDVDDGE